VPAYVTNFGSDTVSAVNTATNAVIATIPVGDAPVEVAIGRGGGGGTSMTSHHHQHRGHADATSADQTSINMDVAGRS
jgi:YVTN family beta-propeller protein